MGLIAGWLAFKTQAGWSQHVRLFLTTGILGGFTTFSAFSLDAIMLWERGEAGLACGLCHRLRRPLAGSACAPASHSSGACHENRWQRNGRRQGPRGRAATRRQAAGSRRAQGPAAKGKRPSHDARRSARASARPRPEREEVEVRTEPTRNPAPHHPAPRAGAKPTESLQRRASRR